jgi:hypothetical protein
MNDHAFGLLMARLDRIEDTLDRISAALEAHVSQDADVHKVVEQHSTYWKIAAYVLTAAGSVSGAVAGYLGMK